MDGLWELQKTINENNNIQMQTVIAQLQMILDILQDRENDIEHLTRRIDELEKEISELKASR